jgi:hypothetical protein
MMVSVGKGGKTMAIKATPSDGYLFILVSEDTQAFSDEKSAIRELKKRWAAQHPAERVGYFIGKVEKYVEPDYAVKFSVTPVGAGGGGGPGGGGGSGGGDDDGDDDGDGDGGDGGRGDGV